MGLFSDFRGFVLRGNVIDLAIGVIIGTAFGRIIASLVEDILMPPIGLLLGGIDFSDLYINLSGMTYANLAAAKAAGAPTLNYGLFLNTIINFLIVAAAVFCFMRQLNRFNLAALSVPNAPTAEEKLLMEIRDAIRAQGMVQGTGQNRP